jgi:hypothetical protein
VTALASALSFLCLARANLADAAAELELTDRHDAALLAEHCDRVDQDIRAIESALTSTAAIAPSCVSPAHSPARSGGGTSLTAAGVLHGPVPLRPEAP